MSRLSVVWRFVRTFGALFERGWCLGAFAGDCAGTRCSGGACRGGDEAGRFGRARAVDFGLAGRTKERGIGDVDSGPVSLEVSALGGDGDASRPMTVANWQRIWTVEEDGLWIRGWAASVIARQVRQTGSSAGAVCDGRRGFLGTS